MNHDKNDATNAAGSPFLLSLFSLAHDMSAVQRFSRLRMVQPENVLAHTGMVCVFAYAITRKLNSCYRLQLEPLDLGWVMARAVVHDMDETITGDIVRPTKYFSADLRAELGRLEAKGINNIALALDMPSIIADFMSAKQGREGFVVKLADLLAALCAVHIEVRVLGNRAMVQAAGGLRLAIDDAANGVNAATNNWSVEERAVIEQLFDEADDLLSTILGYINPLPSLHAER